MHFVILKEKKNVNPKFLKIDKIQGMVTYNIHTKFEFNRMHRLHADYFKEFYSIGRNI